MAVIDFERRWTSLLSINHIRVSDKLYNVIRKAVEEMVCPQIQPINRETLYGLKRRRFSRAFKEKKLRFTDGESEDVKLDLAIDSVAIINGHAEITVQLWLPMYGEAEMLEKFAKDLYQTAGINHGRTNGGGALEIKVVLSNDLPIEIEYNGEENEHRHGRAFNKGWICASEKVKLT